MIQTRVVKATVTALALALVTALAAAGCGGGSSGDDDRVGGAVSFLTFGDPEELQAFRDVIAAFEAKEPDVDVQLIAASDAATCSRGSGRPSPAGRRPTSS